MKTLTKESKNLILFFAITLLWTWSIGFIPILFNLTETTLATVCFIAAGPAPSLVGLFLVLKTYDKPAKKDYFMRCFSLKRMGIKWFIFTLTFFSLIALVSLFIGFFILKYEMPEMLWIDISVKQPYMIPILLFLSLNSGPVNEEFGFRGYALDKLLVRFGYVKSSLILGFIWGIWHLPWYFTPGQVQYELLQSSLFDAFMFIPATILLSFVVSFVYLNTKRSILAGALVHMLFNLITSQILYPYTTQMGITIRYVSMFFCSLIVIYSLLSKGFKDISENEYRAIKQL